TSGGAIAGNCETGRLTIVMAPTMTVSREMTIATMGRLMKNRDTSASGVRGRTGRNVDHGAVSGFQDALDDHTFACFEAVGHDPGIADAVADRHRADRHLVSLAHDGDLVAPLHLRDRALRNQQGAVYGTNGEPDTPVASGPEQIARIG